MVRLGFIIGFIALIGVLLSGLAAYRVHDQELTVDRIALARAIDVHASLVQERLTERELLARVASGLFRTPSVMKANMLQPLRSSIYAFKTDFVVASWIARLKPDELAGGAGRTRRRRLSQSDHPQFRRHAAGYASRSNRPIDVLMDLEPRNAETMGLAGPFSRPASDSGTDVRAGRGQRKAGGVRSASAVAPGWTDRHRAGRAGPAGGRCSARGLRDVFLRTGAADADERRSVAVLGGAERPAQRRQPNWLQTIRAMVTSRPAVAAGSGAVDDPGGDVRRPRLVARLLRQDQFDEARRSRPRRSSPPSALR